MDGKLNYPRFLKCKKPHEKTPIRREMKFFPKGSKTSVFRKIAKGGGTNGKFSKMADFSGNFRKAKK